MTDYYVKNAGNDGLAGTSEAAAWKTIAKVNAASFSAGDRIFFNRGDVWREQLSVPSNGTAASRLLFGAYGSGDRPKITGADLLGDIWSDQGGNRWDTTATITTAPVQVYMNGTKGSEVANVAALAQDGDWVHGDAGANILSIYSTSDPNTRYTSPGVEISQRASCVLSNGKDYLTFEELWLFATNSSHALNVDASSTDVLVRYCTVEYAYNIGIIFTQTEDCIAEHCTIRYNGNDGIWFDRANDSTARYNTMTDNGTETSPPESWDRQEIGVWDATGVKIYGNTITHEGNTRFTIECGGTVAGGLMEVEIYNNFINNTGSTQNNAWAINVYAGTASIHHNIVKSHSDGTGAAPIAVQDVGSGRYIIATVYNNVFVGDGSTTWGIVLPSVATVVVGTSCAIKNNVVVDCAQHIRVRTGWTAVGVVDIDNNCYGDDGAAKFHWNTTDYTFANWQSNSGHDANAVNSDPLFTAQASNDFTLTRNSPCRDAGVGVSLTRDYVNAQIPVGPSPDIGAYEYQTGSRRLGARSRRASSITPQVLSV